MHSTAHKSVAPPINQPWNMCVSLGYFPLHTLATSRNPVIRPVLVRNNRATRPTTGKLKRFFPVWAGAPPVPGWFQFAGRRACSITPRASDSARLACGPVIARPVTVADAASELYTSARCLLRVAELFSRSRRKPEADRRTATVSRA